MKYRAGIWLMAFAILVSTVLPIGRLSVWADGGDKTSALTDVKAVVKQGSTVIEPGGTINISNGDTLSVEVSFGVPVAGDEPTPSTVVEHGDTARFELSQGFALLSGAPLQLVHKSSGKSIGTATLASVSGSVYTDILFDGDSDIFAEDGGYFNVSGEFSAQLRYDNSGSAGEEGTHTVKILGKNYTVVVPPAPVVYNVAKSGVADLAHNKIDWTVNLSATKGATPVDLKDYEFRDDLSNVGTYVPGSFTVDGNPVDDGDLVTTGSVIAYQFPDSSSNPRVVKFSTTIPDNKYYVNNANQSISNIAQLLKDNEVVQSGSGTASFTTPKWIEKTGAAKHPNAGTDATYDPADQFITWTITANKEKASLDNLTITDVLPNGLDFVSAQWQTSTDGLAWTPGSVVGSEPTDGKYTLSGTTSTMVQLVITSKVSNTSTTVGKTTFNNAATLDWDNKPGGVTLKTGNVGIGIGYDALTKSGSLNKATREITWTIKADAKNQTIADMRVYDLLVYDPVTDLSGTTGWPTGIDYTKITKRTGLQYVAGSGTITSGTGTLTDIAIMKSGKRVADLIEVTGLSTAAANTIQFKTLIVNPDVYAGNTSKNVDNTASLFNNTTKLRDATGSVTYDSRTLAKELLKREALADPVAGVNTKRTTNAAEGFDYVDKSVIFRLSVNADGLDFNTAKVASNEANDVLGTATVTDTLPAGWEFTDIVGSQKYLIFSGAPASGSSVDALSTTPEASVSGLTADFNTTGQATFTFNQLDKPYVILVKAKPTGATLDGYFDGNKTSTITNNLNLQAAHWTPGASRSQQVSIKSEILKKSYTGPTSGTLNWSVVYNPNELGTTGESIVDTLPLGLDLRTDAMGKLLLNDGNGGIYISAKELTLQPNGTMADGSDVPLVLGTNLFYDNAARELLFKIPDHSKAYRLNYLTDITGEIGNVVNHASLTAGNADASEQQINYAISSADSSATMMRGGWLEVTKTDGLTPAPLPGAEFTLFATDGSTVIRKAISAADGKLKMKAIPNGDYVLRETVAPTGGYTLEGIDHTVHVDTSGSTVVTTIDGKTGADTNKLTVANYKNNTTGKLIISKTVAGNDGDLTKRFDFTVNFTGAPGVYNYTGTGGAASGTIASGGTLSLSHGQGIIIAGLPADATYKVTETNYANDGYKTSSVGAEGVIAAEQTQTAVFVNTKDKPGNLIISKTVTGNDGDPAQLFDFTVTLSSPGVYNYTGSGGAANGTITSGGKIALAGGQSITIAGLPADTTYSVVENDYAAIGYVTTKTGDTGTIVTNDFQSAAFVNARDDWFGSLKISKTVTGNDGDKAKKFEFTVTLSAPGVYNYTGSGGAGDGTIKSGDTILLADGQSITIEGLARNTTYAVTEANYAADGYVTTKTGDTGTFVTNDLQSADFVNTRDNWFGSLRISKTVTGNAGDKAKKFEFTVTLSAPGVYNYTGSGGAADGTIKSGDKILLADGQSITIKGLVKNTTYNVTEASYAEDGYVTTKTGDTGAIVGGQEQSSAFVNTKNVWYAPNQGSLTINKTVTGNGGDRTKKFNFKVVLDGTNATYNFSGSGGSGTIQSGGTVTLAHGQSVTIAGLPAGTSYTVSEENDAADGYVTTSTGSTGTIQVDSTQVADFVNNKESQEPEQPGNGGDDGDNGNGDDGDNGGNGHNGDNGSSGGSTDSPSGGSTDSPSGGSTDTDSGNGGSDGNSGAADNGSQQGAGSGTPKTGDNNHKQAGQIGLIFFGAALVVLIYANNAARRRSKTGKRQ